MSWKRFRKKNAAATGITQNVTDCLRSPTAKNMLANSEFLLMLSQAPTDQQELVNLLHISGGTAGHISNAESGHGLIKVGGALVPFVNQFPRDTELYRLITTRQEKAYERDPDAPQRAGTKAYLHTSQASCKNAPTAGHCAVK